MSKGAVITLSGNTFPHKDRIKAVGGRWDSDRKAWVIENSGTMSDRKRVDALAFELRRSGVTISEE